MRSGGRGSEGLGGCLALMGGCVPGFDGWVGARMRCLHAQHGMLAALTACPADGCVDRKVGGYVSVWCRTSCAARCPCARALVAGLGRLEGPGFKRARGTFVPGPVQVYKSDVYVLMCVPMWLCVRQWPAGTAACCAGAQWQHPPLGARTARHCGATFDECGR